MRGASFGQALARGNRRARREREPQPLLEHQARHDELREGIPGYAFRLISIEPFDVVRNARRRDMVRGEVDLPLGEVVTIERGRARPLVTTG